jgi:hypothetical protein
MHVGIPVTTRKPGMAYVEDLKLWMSDPEEYDFKIEYLKFEEGTPFPEIMHHNPHIAYEVDAAQPYIDEAERVLIGPMPLDDKTTITFIVKDDTIFELYEIK